MPNVYRVDPQRGRLRVVVDDFVQPNGICFSPDEKKRYVIDSGGTSHIREVRSGHDFWSRPQDATNFSHDATGAHSTRIVTIQDATHFVHLDRPQRGRDLLLRELVSFLSA